LVTSAAEYCTVLKFNERNVLIKMYSVVCEIPDYILVCEELYLCFTANLIIYLSLPPNLEIRKKIVHIYI